MIMAANLIIMWDIEAGPCIFALNFMPDGEGEIQIFEDALLFSKIIVILQSQMMYSTM